MELDIHVWIKPGDADSLPLFTVSRGDYPLCIDEPLQEAIFAIHNHLEDQAELLEED